ncbi:hypothetical protein NDU88_004677 [Pleurodeles waltl]|uniref:Uncharacterized protein n=1 Tax=Pleurodeles waltl TaxID=8319 RepID=A0AAV7UFS3_PLEWA|nr:hypothetical protein NDU88_004677 [Pleurodeles waltl]
MGLLVGECIMKTLHHGSWNLSGGRIRGRTERGLRHLVLLHTGLIIGPRSDDRSTGHYLPLLRRRLNSTPEGRADCHVLGGYLVGICEVVAEERFRLLRETTRFVVDPLVETLEHGNSDQEHETHSDSAYSLLGPLLTLRSADDI